jgi:hypothetical protein
MQVAAHAGKVLPLHPQLQQSRVKGLLHTPSYPKRDDVQVGELAGL